MDARSTRIARWFEWPTLFAAALAIPDIIFLQARADEPFYSIAVVVYWATWLLFVAELIVMMAVVPNRWQWLRRHPIELIVVFLTPPFLSTAAKHVRLLRLTRLLLILRGARLSRSIFSLEGLRYTALLTAAVILGGGAAFAEVEHGTYSLWDGIWWAVESVSTVGYGDIAPTTTGGRMVAIVVIACGVGFLAVLTGYLAERFVVRDVESEIGEVEEQLSDIEDDALDELRAIAERVTRLEARLRQRAGVQDPDNQ